MLSDQRLAAEGGGEMTKEQCEEQIRRWTDEERERYIAEGNSDTDDLSPVVAERVGARIDREVAKNPTFAKAWALVAEEMEAAKNRPNLGPFTDAEVESFVAANKKIERFEREKARLLEEILSRSEPISFQSESDLERHKALLRPVFQVAEGLLEKLVRRFGEQDLMRLQEIVKNAKSAQSTRVETIEFGLTRMEDAEGGKEAK